MYTSTSISLLGFRSKHRPDATMGSCNDSLPRCPSESSPPLHKLQLPLSLPIPIRWSFSTHGNQSKLSRHSFTTTGHSNSEIHRIGHPFSIKWLHMSDLSTPRILPPPFAILQASPTATTSTAEPPPLILTVEPSMRTCSASIRCQLAPPRPLHLPPFTSPEILSEQAGQIKRTTCKGEFLAGCTVKGMNSLGSRLCHFAYKSLHLKTIPCELRSFQKIAIMCSTLNRTPLAGLLKICFILYFDK
jgi:hypothetical protein